MERYGTGRGLRMERGGRIVSVTYGFEKEKLMNFLTVVFGLWLDFMNDLFSNVLTGLLGL